MPRVGAAISELREHLLRDGAALRVGRTISGIGEQLGGVVSKSLYFFFAAEWVFSAEPFAHDGLAKNTTRRCKHFRSSTLLPISTFKKLLGVSLFLAAQLAVPAIQVGNTYEEVLMERGMPRGKLGAGGFVILAYPDATIRLMNNRVVRVGPPPRQLSIVPAPKPKPKPKPVPAWLDDVDSAFAQAREKNRHVLLFFTQADGASRSNQLEADVLSSPEFVHYADENLVLVKMNFPKLVEPLPENTVAAEPEAASAKAAATSKRVKADDMPLVFVLDSDGRPSGTLGYPDGGTGPFIDALKRM